MLQNENLKKNKYGKRKKKCRRQFKNRKIDLEAQ